MGSFVGHKGCCWAIRLSGNSQRAITGSADFSAKIWDANTGTCLLTLPHEHIVKCVDMSPDGTKAVTGGHEKKLKLWDVEALLATLASSDAATQSSAGDAPPTTSNGTGNGNGTATGVNQTNGKTDVPADAYKLFKQSEDSQLAHDAVVKAIIWDAPNNQIISAGEDKTVKFWDAETLQLKEVMKVSAAITSMERNHDLAGTISLTYGNTVDFIDPKTCVCISLAGLTFGESRLTHIFYASQTESLSFAYDGLPAFYSIDAPNMGRPLRDRIRVGRLGPSTRRLERAGDGGAQRAPWTSARYILRKSLRICH